MWFSFGIEASRSMNVERPAATRTRLAERATFCLRKKVIRPIASRTSPRAKDSAIHGARVPRVSYRTAMRLALFALLLLFSTTAYAQTSPEDAWLEFTRQQNAVETATLKDCET